MVAVTRANRASRRPAFAALSAELRQSSKWWGRRPEGPAALPDEKDRITASIAWSWSVAHVGAKSGRSSCNAASRLGPSA